MIYVFILLWGRFCLCSGNNNFPYLGNTVHEMFCLPVIVSQILKLW